MVQNAHMLYCDAHLLMWKTKGSQAVKIRSCAISDVDVGATAVLQQPSKHVHLNSVITTHVTLVE